MVLETIQAVAMDTCPRECCTTIMEWELQGGIKLRIVRLEGVVVVFPLLKDRLYRHNRKVNPDSSLPLSRLRN
jgi:hypothetical protein